MQTLACCIFIIGGSLTRTRSSVCTRRFQRLRVTAAAKEEGAPKEKPPRPAPSFDDDDVDEALFDKNVWDTRCRPTRARLTKLKRVERRSLTGWLWKRICGNWKWKPHRIKAKRSIERLRRHCCCRLRSESKNSLALDLCDLRELGRCRSIKKNAKGGIGGHPIYFNFNSQVAMIVVRGIPQDQFSITPKSSSVWGNI